jgi:cyclic pyranopterin phosphate synthase
VRPFATRAVFDHAWQLVLDHDLVMHFDLYGYSIPFFTSGPEGELAFRPEDEDSLRELVRHVLELSRSHGQRFPHSEPFLRSIPDWVVKREAMRIPCDAYRFLWVGPDGSVQLCDTSFPLGNVNETPLRELVFGPEHRQAARGAFELSCPNCTCQVEDRIRKHGPSWRHYSKESSL